MRMKRTAAQLVLLVVLCVIAVGCGKSKSGGSDDEFESEVIVGGSRAVARDLPRVSRNSRAPSISGVAVTDSVVRGGRNLELEIEFVDSNRDVADLYAQIDGEDGYLVFPVRGAGGLNAGIIDADIETRNSSPPDQYRLTVVLVDRSGNVSNHIDILITVSPSSSSDFTLNGCYSGDSSPDLTGTWEFTYLITEVPPDLPIEIRDLLLGEELTERIAISGSNRERTGFRYPDPMHLLSGSTFYGPVSGAGDDVSFGFMIDTDFSIPEIGADCSMTVSQQVCGTLDCNTLTGESVLIYLDLTGNRVCRDAREALGAAFRFKAQTTATRISGGPISCSGLSCTPGETEACDTGQQGVCSEGTRTCNASGTGFGVCIREQSPQAEDCGNDLDDDCDGLVDDDDPECGSILDFTYVETIALPITRTSGRNAIAVDERTGRVYVRQHESSVSGGGRISVVTTDGLPIGSFPYDSGVETSGIAVDFYGAVYVPFGNPGSADAGVRVYSSGGSLLREWGVTLPFNPGASDMINIAVSNSSDTTVFFVLGNIFVGGGSVIALDRFGTPRSSWSFAAGTQIPRDVSIDTGRQRLYFLRSSAVESLDFSGTPISSFDSEAIAAAAVANSGFLDTAVSDFIADEVRLFANGSLTQVIERFGTSSLDYPTGVALNSGGTQLWIADINGLHLYER